MVENRTVGIDREFPPVNPFDLPRSERWEYFKNYMDAAIEPGGDKTRRVYAGGEDLRRFQEEGVFGIGAVVEVGGGIKYILSPDGWRYRDYIEYPPFEFELADAFDSVHASWTIAPHSREFGTLKRTSKPIE